MGSDRKPGFEIGADIEDLTLDGVSCDSSPRQAFGNDGADPNKAWRGQAGPVHRKMGRARHDAARQHGLELASRFQSLHFASGARTAVQLARCGPRKSDRQTLAPFGSTGVDHGATTAGFHANQESVGAGSANLGGLVSAFHIEILKCSITARCQYVGTCCRIVFPRQSQSNRRLSQTFQMPAIADV